MDWDLPAIVAKYDFFTMSDQFYRRKDISLI